MPRNFVIQLECHSVPLSHVCRLCLRSRLAFTLNELNFAFLPCNAIACIGIINISIAFCIQVVAMSYYFVLISQVRPKHSRT